MGVHILPSTLSVEFLFHTFCESVYVCNYSLSVYMCRIFETAATIATAAVMHDSSMQQPKTRLKVLLMHECMQVKNKTIGKVNRTPNTTRARALFLMAGNSKYSSKMSKTAIGRHTTITSLIKTRRTITTYCLQYNFIIGSSLHFLHLNSHELPVGLQYLVQQISLHKRIGNRQQSILQR